MAMFAMLNKIESIVKGTGYIELKGYNAGYKQDRMSVLVSKGEQSYRPTQELEWS